MKYIQFTFATGKKNIIPMRTKKEIKAYMEKFAYTNGGVCHYEEVKRENAFMFDCYNRIYG